MEEILKMVMEYIVEFGVLTIIGFAAYLLKWVADKFKIDTLSKQADEIMNEAIELAKKELTEIDGKFDVEKVSNRTTEYVLKNGPKVFKKLGYNNEQIKNKAKSKL